MYTSFRELRLRQDERRRLPELEAGGPFGEAPAAQRSPSRDEWAARRNEPFATIETRMLAVATADSTAGLGSEPAMSAGHVSDHV
jgi:hypothetical protein